MHQPLYNDKSKALNKSTLIETIVRNRIKDSIFYKQHLYLTNEQTILPIIIQHVQFIGGMDSNNRPSPFLCCLLRLLEINPLEGIVKTYLSFPEFKYLTCLVLLVIRLTQPAVEVYKLFDNYITNHTNLRTLLDTPDFTDGIPRNYTLTYMDQFIDDLITKERYISIILTRMEKRFKLADKGLIADRKYYVTDEIESPDASSPEAESPSDFESDSD